MTFFDGSWLSCQLPCAKVLGHVCLSDEAYLQQTSNGGNLPMVPRKKRLRLEDEAKAAAEAPQPTLTCIVPVFRIYPQILRYFPLHLANRKQQNTANQRINTDATD